MLNYVNSKAIYSETIPYVCFELNCSLLQLFVLLRWLPNTNIVFAADAPVKIRQFSGTSWDISAEQCKPHSARFPPMTVEQQHWLSAILSLSTNEKTWSISKKEEKILTYQKIH